MLDVSYVVATEMCVKQWSTCYTDPLCGGINLYTYIDP